MTDMVAAPERKSISLGPPDAEGPAMLVERTAGFATKPLAKDALRRLHDRFVADPAATDLSMLRPVIARSWLRSQACNVSPGVRFLEAIQEPQIDEHVLRCAEPVLRDLEQTCVDTGGCVSLTDARGTIAVFRGEPSVVRWAERLFPLTGGSMLEEVSGTNSEGTALEEGFGVQVWGAEHFAELLHNSCCTSVPIRDPLRRSVRAVLSLTLPEQVASYADARSIGLVVQGAAAEVTRSLAAHLAAREQALLSAYLREVRKRGTDAVVAMDGRTTIASRGAMQLLDQSDYAVLAGYAHEAERRRRLVEHDVMVGPGRMLHLHARPIEVGEETAGCVLRLRSVPPAVEPTRRRDSARRTDDFPSLVGESLALRRALDVASTAARRGLPVYLLGERGTGKLHLAEEIASRLSSQTVAVDCEGSEQEILEQLEGLQVHVAGGGAAVLHHVDLMPQVARPRLLPIIDALKQPKVVLTTARLTDDVLDLTAALGAVEIQMPPLRLRRDDIPLLAASFIQALPHGPERASSRLLQMLAEAHWPGNVRQLKDVVCSAAERATSREVGVDDLAQAHRKAMARHPLSRLEEAELQEIRDALIEAGGNRVRAAVILQIGRSTLYRKIDMYMRRGFDVGARVAD